MTSELIGKRKLKKSPLVAVLAEVRFAPILTIENLVPAIQEELRRSGFPGFSTSTVHQFQIAIGGEPTFQASSRWLFSSKDNTEAVALSTEGISLRTTKYDVFDDFLATLGRAVEVLARIGEPSFADRIGLRYVDAVPDVGESLPTYFNETVLTFSPEQLGVESLLSSQHILAKTDIGHLQIRMNQVENAPLLPPDLISPELGSLVTPRQGTHAILDIDSSDEGRSDFAWEAIEERLWAVHEYASSAFWKSVTKEARATWGEEEVPA